MDRLLKVKQAEEEKQRHIQSIKRLERLTVLKAIDPKKLTQAEKAELENLEKEQKVEDEYQARLLLAEQEKEA